MKDKKNKVSFQIIFFILIAILFGFGAGLVGEIWLNDLLLTGSVDGDKIKTITERLDELTEKQDKKLKEILDEKDMSISQTIEQVRPAIVSFYLNKNKNQTYNDILLSNDLYGYGIVMTADGWLLTDKSVLADKAAQVVVAFDNKIYELESTVCDTNTTACFVKISAKNLSVVNLTSRQFLTNGQTALVVSREKIISTSIENLYYDQIDVRGDLIHSSEKFYKNIKLVKSCDDEWVGSPVVNLDGHLIGILTESNIVLPTDNIQRVIKQAVSDGKVVRNLLGVHYIDLGEAIGWEKYSELDEGALIFGIAGKPAVLANSPAKKAGLKQGDIITYVENEQVNASNSLTNLIQSYKTGEEIKLEVLRGQEEIEIKVVLKEL